MSTSTALPSGVWELDASATTITVTAQKLGAFSIPATLDVSSGSIVIDENNQVQDVNIVADATSYASKNAKRNDHIISADFLDAANHPTISLHCGEVTPGQDGYNAKGTVTVKGRTSPVDISIADVRFDDSGATFTASATVDRNAIGVDKLPTFIIGRDLTLTVSAKATKSESTS